MQKSNRSFSQAADPSVGGGVAARGGASTATLESRLRFDGSYSEEVVLRDGTRVRIRSVQPGDKERLQEGLGKLSSAAVVARFFTPRGPFSRAELKYLTECDGLNHFAIGAVSVNADGSEGEGLAVGRFVRSAEDPTAAEPAVVVLDHCQGMGLGRLVFDRLIEAARERGVCCFRAEFLANNNAIQRLLEGVCPDLVLQRAGDVVRADVPIPPLDAPVTTEATSKAMSVFMRLTAEGLLCLRVRSPRRWNNERTARTSLKR